MSINKPFYFGHKNKPLAMLILCLLVVGCTPQNKKFPYQEWCGQYALMDYPDKNGFFKEEKISQSLKTFLPPAYIRKMTSQLTTHPPIKCLGSFLILTGCKPHDCPNEHYLLFIDTQSWQILACFWKVNHHMDDRRGTMSFYGSHFSMPLILKNVNSDLGFHFTEYEIENLVERVCTVLDEKDQKNAIRKFIQEKFGETS